MNANELRPLLVEYRAEVEKGWTAATAHGGYEAGPGLPAGQCGPTSAWLQKRLWLDHGVRTIFATGSMFTSRPKVELRQHCWLETERHCIVDLTAGQVGGPEVVCIYWPYTDTEYGLSYSVSMFMHDLSDQADLLRRTALLTEAVGR